MIQNYSDNVTIPENAAPTVLAGRYRVVRQLGQGGMGSVWLAEDTKLDGRKVAIKMLPSILVSNKRAYRQVKDEALVSLRLSHPNIVSVRSFEEDNSNPFLVMDYIDGQTLDDYLADKGKLSEEETITLLKPIADALDYAHSQGVVHRDVKPGNVMIAADGHPYILDFGIAREVQETMTRVTGKQSSGTLMYMSPEQLNGAAPKFAQDVYSFAAMAYECLKGEPPFNRGQIEYQIVNNNPEPLWGNIAICPSVMSGLEKTPSARPMTCAAVLTAGTKNVGGTRSAFGCVGLAPSARVASANRTRIAAVLLGLLTVAVLVVGGWWLGREPEENKGSAKTNHPSLVVRRPKPVVGVMTSLQGVLCEQSGAQEQRSSKGWAAFAELAKDCEVKTVATDAQEIGPEVKTLIVLHAKELSDKTLYAIDQFVLRGGKLVACVDPFSIKDMIASRQQQNPMMMQMGGGMDGPSTLGKLFDAWGVKFDTAKITADLAAATKLNNGLGGVDDNPAFLSLGAANMDKGDILVQNLTQVMFPFAGAFTFEKKEGVEFVPVITTSKESSCSTDRMAMMMGGSIKDMVPDGHERVLAARLSGTFKTAFPRGPDGTNDVSKVLAEGKGSVLLFADSDFLADDFCVRTIGCSLEPINDNLSLFSNVIEQFAVRD